MDWEEEYVHLDILQDKINLYVDYFANEKYKNDRNCRKFKFEYAIIELYFKYEITQKAKDFIYVVNKQLMKQLCIQTI